MSVASPEAVRCLYLPLTEDGALLPLAGVAEVIGYVAPAPFDAASGTPPPAWVAGSVPWRGRALPVGTWEALLGRRFRVPGRGGRIVVLHGVASPERLPFHALVVQGTPRTVIANATTVHWRLDRDDLTGGDGARDACLVGWVEVAGRAGWIPQLDAIESALLTATGG